LSIYDDNTFLRESSVYLEEGSEDHGNEDESDANRVNRGETAVSSGGNGGGIESHASSLVLGSGDTNREGGGDGGGVSNSNNALSPSNTSITNGGRAIVLSGVDDNSVSKNGILAIHRDHVVGVIIVSGSPRIIVDVTHISNVSLGEGRDSVGEGERAIVRSSSSSGDVGNISKFVDVESVGSSIQTSDSSINSGRSHGRSLFEVDGSTNVVLSKGVGRSQHTHTTENSGYGSGSSGVDVSNTRVGNSDNAIGPSRGRDPTGRLSGTIVSYSVEDNGSSDDRIGSGKSDDVQRFGLGDGSSGNGPVAHVSHMTVGVGRAGVVVGTQRIIMSASRTSSGGREISILMEMHSVLTISGDSSNIGGYINCSPILGKSNGTSDTSPSGGGSQIAGCHLDCGTITDSK